MNDPPCLVSMMYMMFVTSLTINGLQAVPGPMPVSIDIRGYNIESLPDYHHPGGQTVSISSGRNGYEISSCINFPDYLGPVTAVKKLDFCLQMYHTNDCNGKVDYYLISGIPNLDNLRALGKKAPKSFKTCKVTEEEVKDPCPSPAGCRRGLVRGNSEYNFWVALFNAAGRQDWHNEFIRRTNQHAYINWNFLYDGASKTVLQVAPVYSFPSNIADQYQLILQNTPRLIQQGAFSPFVLQSLRQMANQVSNNRNSRNAIYTFNPHSRTSVAHYYVARHWSTIVSAFVGAAGAKGK